MTALLPSGVACEQLIGDQLLGDQLPGDRAGADLRRTDATGELYPAEFAAVAGAVEKRRHEFAAARGLARRAMVRLGHPPAPILPGDRGAPVWPPGVVGSLTHCPGYTAAAVAPLMLLHSLGIDAEPDAPLPDDVLGVVAGPAELSGLAALADARPGPAWDRILFSAKESVYKAWYPLTGRWLGFEEAEVGLEPDGRFVAHLLVPGPVVDGVELTAFAGRWSAGSGLVLTAVAVPVSGIPGFPGAGGIPGV